MSQGRQNQKRGAAFERSVRAGLKVAGAFARHIPTPTQILRTAPAAPGRRPNRAIVIARLEKPENPDWLGTLPGGKSLALETKTASGTGYRTSWPLDARLKGHQGGALAAVSSLGGVAAVLLCRDLLEGGQDLYLLPWPECDPRPKRQSWAWADIEQWRVPRGRKWWEALADWERYRLEGW